MDKENIEFYYKNQKEINKLVKFKYNLREHIVSQIVTAGDSLHGLNKYEPRANSFNDNRLVYYVSSRHKNLMITVVYEDLLTQKQRMYIAVELQGNLLKDRSIYNEIEFTKEEQQKAFAEHFKTTSESWSHFAIEHYHPTDTEISNLSEFILEKLNEDHLLAVFKKLELFLDIYKTT